MTEEAAPPISSPPVDLAQRILALATNAGCDIAVVNAALGITDPQFGGSPQNIYHAIPVIAQEVLRVQEVAATDTSSPLDLNKDRGVDTHELTAAMIAAAQVAKAHRLSLAQLDSTHLAEIADKACPILAQIQRKEKAVCRP